MGLVQGFLEDFLLILERVRIEKREFEIGSRVRIGSRRRLGYICACQRLGSPSLDLSLTSFPSLAFSQQVDPSLSINLGEKEEKKRTSRILDSGE